MPTPENDISSIISNTEKRYSVFEITGISIVIISSIPVVFVLIFVAWQILINVGLDVAPR